MSCSSGEFEIKEHISCCSNTYCTHFLGESKKKYVYNCSNGQAVRPINVRNRADQTKRIERSGQINKRRLLFFCILGCLFSSPGLASSPNPLCATLNVNVLLFFSLVRTLTRDNPSPSCNGETACKITFFGGNIKTHTDCLSNSPPASFVRKHLAAFIVSVSFLVGLVIEL